jgi:hypothetical protein
MEIEKAREISKNIKKIDAIDKFSSTIEPYQDTGCDTERIIISNTVTGSQLLFDIGSNEANMIMQTLTLGIRDEALKKITEA